MGQSSSRRRTLVRAVTALALTASLAGVGGITVVATVRPAGATPATGAAIAAAAASQAGKPYCEGGGGINGASQPTNGMAPCSAPGYDCMSLAQYAVFQVTGITVPSGTDVSLPGPGTLVPADGTADLQPGDVVFFGGSSLDGYAHSGVYAGDGEVWDALVAGTNVQEHSFGDLNNDYQQVYWGAVRYAADTTTPPTTTTTTTTTSVPTPPPSFGITTSSLVGGTATSRAHPVTYLQTLGATGGRPPYRWSIVKGSGSLPTGLRLKAATGVISGKAKVVGTFSFEVKVVGKKAKGKASTASSAVRSLSITIQAAP
jgi:hypothetical protein